ncbi:MAG: heparin lyase I family protein [Deltaproteobacteria bacterium]|nr:heparin lyase I family protein [Deltaproteobacteria bacterium]
MLIALLCAGCGCQAQLNSPTPPSANHPADLGIADGSPADQGLARLDAAAPPTDGSGAQTADTHPPTQPAGTETADVVFGWSDGPRVTAGVRAAEFSGIEFWRKGINCSSKYIELHKDSTRTTFGVDNVVRYPGTKSVQFFSDRNLEARCNQHTTSHRAEMWATTAYRRAEKDGTVNNPSLGVDVGTPGSTAWIGWSEYYEKMDTLNFSTLMQFRSNPEFGGPAVSIEYRPDNPYKRGVGMYIRTRSQNEPKEMGYHYIGSFETGVWYDFVVKIRYSYLDESGSIRLWRRAARPGDPAIPPFEYDKPTVAKDTVTLHGIDSPIPDGDQKDTTPHLRWGLYRHSGSEVDPAQIPVEHRVAIKYIGPVRIKLGESAEGLQAVLPRP